ncbi:unnamed protein product, partial [Dicrocoelium dendriticum]
MHIQLVGWIKCLNTMSGLQRNSLKYETMVASSLIYMIRLVASQTIVSLYFRCWITQTEESYALKIS